ncbi:MAG: peptidoglycan DD-metalloendopeptidase family protein [Chitinophagaceae bacterium]|nr:peptidoglycan DD-metalloendopeptidase family protein [Chitinophagaceae bacterium]
MRNSFTVILILLAFAAAAQQPTREELEQRRMQLLQTIKETESQLAATQKNTKATMGQLRALQTKLAGRQKLIDNINQEIGQIGSSIDNSNKEITRLKGNLDILKARYAQSVRYAYKSRSSYDMLAFLFSSDDFNEAVRRLKYLKRYRDYRKDQADQIRLTQTKLKEEISSLNSEKAKKDILLSAEEQQKQAIEEDKNKTDQIVKELKGQEKELTAKIMKNRRIQQQLDKAVEDMIRKEMELARKKAEEERKRREAEERRKREEEQRRQEAIAKAKEEERRKAALAANTKTNGNITVENYPASTPPANNKPDPVAATPPPADKPTEPKKQAPAYDYGLTPEAAALSNSFEANRGKLPWPVEKGFISLGFGPYKHPIADKVTLINNGVNISTSPGAPVRACFEGTVARVFTIDGKQWNVAINHGRYFTLYTNLAKVSVKADQKVSTKQNIGSAAINEDGESVINFQLWLETKKVDPEQWIAR